MTHNVASSLADITAIYRYSSNQEGRCNITCAYCDATAKQVVIDTARHWFIEHACKTTTIPHVTEPLPKRDHAADLTRRDAAVAWEVMTLMLLAIEQTYGGHRSGTGTSIAENCRNDENIKRILTRVLGGVPTGKAPRSAEVINLDAYRRDRERQTVAA